ncbi:MAG: hypothetical protein AB2L14_17280 [Candidatus Xenobiia bacterium LiM19]
MSIDRVYTSDRTGTDNTSRYVRHTDDTKKAASSDKPVTAPSPGSGINDSLRMSSETQQGNTGKTPDSSLNAFAAAWSLGLNRPSDFNSTALHLPAAEARHSASPRADVSPGDSISALRSRKDSLGEHGRNLNNFLSQPAHDTRHSNRGGRTGDRKGWQVKGKAKGSGYYPNNSAMEGGFKDMKGKKLHTLQDFLNGKAPYVSMAMDKNLYKKGIVKYGDKFRIPELEKKYGRPIIFRAVDTGGAFTNKGFNRVDICCGSRKDTLDSTINGRLTLERE